nr:uncharacterized protein LOC127297585 [Lolium perenne]
MTPQQQAKMRACFAELDAREAKMTPKDKDECNAYFKHLESKSDTAHDLSVDTLISNNLTSTPLVLSSSLLGYLDIYDVIAMEMRDSTICEMSASTICEIESHHLEDMSDTPSEMRVVVDRSCEAIFNSNILPSTSSVFPCVSLGSMDDETPIMEKMYMVHEDDDITPCLLEDEHAGHMDPTTSTTPTSYEREYKGTRKTRSTSIEHELTKRALESIIQVSTRSNPALIPFPCFALNMPNNFSFLWFFCKHDDVILTIGITTNMRTNFSFRWFVCTHVDDTLDTLPYVFLPNSPLIASRMLNNFSFRCLECNNAHEFLHEMDIIVISQFGVFVFSHLEDVHTEFLHIDLAYAFLLIYLCCANGVVNMNGHVIHDMLLYHARTYFAWSLLCEGTSDLWMSVNEWVQPHTSTTQDLSMRAHRYLAKVTSFYLRSLAKPFELLGTL